MSYKLLEQGSIPWRPTMNNVVEGNKRRYHKRRKLMVEFFGGKCERCGSEKNLDFDHIDPSSKEYDIGKVMNYPNHVILAELAKCQLLCRSCHISKTIKEHGGAHNKGISNAQHGSHTMYIYGCRCDLCKEAKRLSRKK
jgi:5-methylcytosine-specific restriction endonuclease McrA